MKKIHKILVLVLFLTPFIISAQSLVYKPISPFFGGDTFNYQQLLASAEAQNDFKEDDSFSFETSSDLDNFAENLNRQLLNSLSQGLFQEQFSNSNFNEEGTFIFGSLVIEIVPTVSGLSVSILDTTSGEQTQIIIPN